MRRIGKEFSMTLGSVDRLHGRLLPVERHRLQVSSACLFQKRALGSSIVSKMKKSFSRCADLVRVGDLDGLERGLGDAKVLKAKDPGKV